MFYNRVFMHIHSRDESLSQTFCSIIGFIPTQIRALRTSVDKDNQTIRERTGFRRGLKVTIGHILENRIRRQLS